MPDLKSENLSEIKNLPGIAFLSFPGMQNMLLSELKNRFDFTERPKAIYGDVLYFSSWPSAQKFPYWAKAVFVEPKTMRFSSISNAANFLKSIQRNWAPYQYQFFRRTALIQDKLPYINLKTRKFPCKIPSSPIGIYTLTDENTILFSEKTSNSLPAGNIVFEEDQIGRAHV